MIDITFDQLFKLNQLPTHSMSIYLKKGDHYQIFTGVYSKVSALGEEVDEIIVRPDRNISYSKLIEKDLLLQKANATSSSEYTFSSGSNQLLHQELDEIQCREFVAKEVRKFVEGFTSGPEEVEKIVLGVSGGGDSNTLIEAFLKVGFKVDQLVCVMMLGIPDWDKGKERARELCKNFGVELRFVEEEEVNSLLGRKKKSEWVTDFEQTFPDADLEVLGTLAIRLSLAKVAKEVQAKACVVGLNLEDLLAESYLQVLKGDLPLEFPVREIDQLKLWYPLYRCPKKILDGCYPKYSLQNYMDRYPSKMKGRAIPYYLAQMAHHNLPGAEFDLIDGFQKLSRLGRDQLIYDQDLGFSSLGKVGLTTRRKWKNFLGVPA